MSSAESGFFNCSFKFQRNPLSVLSRIPLSTIKDDITGLSMTSPTLTVSTCQALSFDVHIKGDKEMEEGLTLFNGYNS